MIVRGVWLFHGTVLSIVWMIEIEGQSSKARFELKYRTAIISLIT